MSKLNYTLSLLNASVITGYLFLIVYAIMKWQELSEGDGYGVVALVLVIILISSALVIDFLLQLLIKNKIIQNSIGAVFILIYAYIILLYS
jgi:hypothetical protein